MQNFIFERISDLPVLFIRDFYDKEEYALIFAELDYLSKIDRFKHPQDPGGPGTAISNGTPLKVGRGLHLDVVYEDRSFSDILKLNRKLFDKNLTRTMEGYHPFFRYLNRSSKDSTKLHYFEDGDHYKSHIDDCVITAVSWFYKQPKSFTGGDIILENKVKFPCLNNSVIIFPSILYHEVTEVAMENLPGMGRYSMSQFLYM